MPCTLPLPEPALPSANRRKSRDVASLLPPDLGLSNLEHTHHPVILVIEDVTVEHPLSRVVVVPDDEARRLMLRDVDDVLPATVLLGHAIAVEHLELVAVQMERVIHADEILDLPDLE